jgi:hypothetical protein
VIIVEFISSTAPGILWASSNINIVLLDPKPLDDNK